MNAPIEKNGNSRRIRRLTRDWRFWVVAVVALYTLVGFIVVPMVAKHEIPKQTRALLQCESSVKSVRFNPYTFNARVRGFEMKDRKGEPLGSVAELFVNFAPWPLTKKQVVLEDVRAVSPVVFVRMRADGTPNMLDLVPVATATEKQAATKEEPSDMVIRVDRASITGGSVEWHDLTTTPEAVASFDSINATALSYRSTPKDTTKFDLSFAQRGTKGRAKAKGWVMPLELVMQARIDVDSLSVVPADPYLGQFAHLDIKSGKIAAHGDMHMAVPADSLPVIDYHGDLVSDDLHLYDNLKKQDFFGYKRLSVLKSEVKSNPPAARVEEFLVDGIYARIAIAADRSFNVTDVFAPAMAMANPPAKAGAVVSSTAVDSTHNVTVEVKTKSNTTKAAATSKTPPPDIAIGRIKIDGGEVDFSDLSLPLPFATRVHHVAGEITAIAPDNAAGSSVKIEGTVDEHGFAKATGFINVFDPVAFTNIKVDFRNIELTSMTPYSGKFMGYRIKHGKLSLGLAYDIKQAQLQAENKILLEKLYLGEKVPSKDAVGLPIKLALALLRDKNGNIDLNVAVHGDLNDPKVNTGALIWQALKKVILKVTTAPFRFLGNLIGIGGGGDDMEYIEFEGGAARLTPPQHERLDNLGKALVERPQLKLQVSGAYDKSIDTAALKAHRFDALLMSRLLTTAKGDTAAVRAILADPSSGPMQRTLEGMMTESFGAEKVVALKAERTIVPAEGGAARLDLATYFQAMREQLTNAQPVSDAELQQLSTARANAIKGYMLEMAKIPVERLEIIEPDVSDDKGEWVRCKLALDASD